MNFGHIDFSLRSRDCHLDEVKVEPKGDYITVV